MSSGWGWLAYTALFGLAVWGSLAWADRREARRARDREP